MIERLYTFLAELNISISAFEKQIGASNGLIRKAIKNNTDIQSKWVSSIAENYPQLNIEWLLVGRGSMLNHSITSDVECKVGLSDEYVNNLINDKNEFIEYLQNELKRKNREIDKLTIIISKMKSK